RGSGRAGARARRRSGALELLALNRAGGALADRVDHLGPFEHTAEHLALGVVPDVRILENLLQRPAASVLPDDVGGQALLVLRACGHKRERASEQAGEAPDAVRA